MDDWQLARHRNPYEASKYQMELLATYLNQLSLLTKSTPEDKVPNSIHIVTQPGVLATNLDKLNNTGVRSLVRTLTLFIVNATRRFRLLLGINILSALLDPLCWFTWSPTNDVSGSSKCSTRSNGYRTSNLRRSGQTQYPIPYNRLSLCQSHWYISSLGPIRYGNGRISFEEIWGDLWDIADKKYDRQYSLRVSIIPISESMFIVYLHSHYVF